jgi:uncharacterized coiled-coil protein SlyX
MSRFCTVNNAPASECPLHNLHCQSPKCIAAEQTSETGTIRSDIVEAFDMTRSLIREAKPREGYITDHLDAAEGWLDNAEELAAAQHREITALRSAFAISEQKRADLATACEEKDARIAKLESERAVEIELFRQLNEALAKAEYEQEKLEASIADMASETGWVANALASTIVADEREDAARAMKTVIGKVINALDGGDLTDARLALARIDPAQFRSKPCTPPNN